MTQSDAEIGENLLFNLAKSKRGGIMPKSRKKSTKKIEDNWNIKDDYVVKESKEKRGDCEMKCEPGHAFHAVDGSSFCSVKDLGCEMTRFI